MDNHLDAVAFVFVDDGLEKISCISGKWGRGEYNEQNMQKMHVFVKQHNRDLIISQFFRSKCTKGASVFSVNVPMLATSTLEVSKN